MAISVWEIKNNMKKKTGFTLVELSFSVVFIAIIALMVVYVSLNTTNIFQRGIATKEINTVGNSIIDDFRAAIANSSAKNLKDICEINYAYAKDDDIITASQSQKDCQADGSYSMIYNVRMGDVVIDGYKDKITNIPISGAFCSGVYSYVWNSGYFFDSEKYTVFRNGSGTEAEPATLKYYSGDNNTEKTVDDIRLVRITDPSRQVCYSKVKESTEKSSISKYITTDKSEFINTMQERPNYDISDIREYSAIYGDTVELLSDNKYNNLALYSLKLYRPAQSEISHNIFFAGSFILASIAGGPNIKAASNYCITPDDYANEDFNYCSINKFNFAIQANGE